MSRFEKKTSGIPINPENREYIANTYVMRCFNVMMVVYLITFMLNLAGIFTIEQRLMLSAFIPSLIIYIIMQVITRRICLSDRKTKYFILTSIIVVSTISGVFLTYHVILISLLPFLYGTLYSSKKVMRVVYGLTVASTFVIVYAGYYLGLCDANMVLLTSRDIGHYVIDGLFVLIQANENPLLNLLLFFVVPRCLIYIAFVFVCNSIVEIVSGSRKKTEQLFVQTVTALSDAVDAKDRYTSGHSKRVAEYSRRIAERLGKSRSEQEEIYRAGLLHDVGKIRIPEEIINKPGRLTDEEVNIIKIHPVTGYHILRGISEESIIAIAAKYHHERYDGKGYPNGLEGDKIPEVARIIGVADSYDAMASNRSYRTALPQEVVRKEIEKGRGTQFDPQMADVMLQMIDEDKEYRMKESDSMHRRVLIVDDEPMNSKRISFIMQDEPRYEILSAESGKEALGILEEQRMDLILLDVMMPEMDGLETLRRIREKYDTPVVLMTGDKTLEASVEFAELGCDDYITKPVLPLLIKEIIHNMTERVESL
ncbi:MAG: response regulator [Lachnospiraceae bacterium]|nr:response regulator [Lachnospiraceae bacterium]